MAKKTTKQKLKNIKKKLNSGDLDPTQRAKFEARQKYLQGRQKKQKSGGGGLAKKINRADSPGDLYKVDKRAERDEAEKDIGYQNPNVYNPLGSTETSIDENGNVRVDQKLSDEQQGILDRGQQLTKYGQQGQMNFFGPQVGTQHQGDFRMMPASMGGDMGNPGDAMGSRPVSSPMGGVPGSGLDQRFQLQLNQRPGSGNLSADRARIEDEAFSRLTRDYGKRKQEDWEDQERAMRNRGITLDPSDKRYADALEQHNQRYDDLYGQARQEATMMGGQEYSRSFGIGEQTRANQMNEQLAQRGQMWSDFGNLGNVGTGLMMPNFQQYQGPNYDPSRPSDMYFGYNQQQQNQQQIDNQRAATEAANRLAQQKLGQGGTEPKSPFYS